MSDRIGRDGGPAYITATDGETLKIADKENLGMAELWSIRFGVAGGFKFEIPADCRRCRAFEAAMQTEPPGSGWRAKLVPVLSEYRLVHHHPRFAFMDRSVAFIERLKAVYKGEQLLDLARFVAMAEASSQ